MTKAVTRAVTYIHISTELRERTKTVARRLSRTITDIIREATEEKVTALEEKFAAVDEKKAEQEGRKQRPLPRYTIGNLAPVPGTSANDLAPTIDGFTALPPKDDSLAAIYSKFAKAIAIAADQNNNDEVKYRAQACIAAVKKEHPLTFPPDTEILENLEIHVRRLRAAGLVPPTKTLDSFVSAVNPSSITATPSPNTPPPTRPPPTNPAPPWHSTPAQVVGPALAHVPGTVVSEIDPTRVPTQGDIDSSSDSDGE
jgi:predicted DNA-binding protein